MGFVKIRFQGLPEDVELALDILRQSRHFEMLEVSQTYPDRGESKFVRQYLTVQPLNVSKLRIVKNGVEVVQDRFEEVAADLTENLHKLEDKGLL